MIDIVLARKLPTVTDHCSLLPTAPDSLHSSGLVRLTNYRSLCSCNLSLTESAWGFALLRLLSYIIRVEPCIWVEANEQLFCSVVKISGGKNRKKWIVCWHCFVVIFKLRVSSCKSPRWIIGISSTFGFHFTKFMESGCHWTSFPAFMCCFFYFKFLKLIVSVVSSTLSARDRNGSPVDGAILFLWLKQGDRPPSASSFAYSLRCCRIPPNGGSYMEFLVLISYKKVLTKTGAAFTGYSG